MTCTAKHTVRSLTYLFINFHEHRMSHEEEKRNHTSSKNIVLGTLGAPIFKSIFIIRNSPAQSSQDPSHQPKFHLICYCIKKASTANRPVYLEKQGSYKQKHS